MFVCVCVCVYVICKMCGCRWPSLRCRRPCGSESNPSPSTAASPYTPPIPHLKEESDGRTRCDDAERSDSETKTCKTRTGSENRSSCPHAQTINTDLSLDIMKPTKEPQLVSFGYWGDCCSVCTYVSSGGQDRVCRRLRPLWRRCCWDTARRMRSRGPGWTSRADTENTPMYRRHLCGHKALKQILI